MRDAFATEDMGVVLRTYRYHPAHGHKPLSQETISRWLGRSVTQSQLSRIESGQNQVDSRRKLIHIAQALHMPADLLWFKLPGQAVAPSQHGEGAVFALPNGGPVIPAAGVRAGSALADALLETLGHYVTTDDLVGSRSLVVIVGQQLQFIDEQATKARGKDKDRLRYVGARYAEFAGWVYQDAGDLDSAMQVSSTAFDYAQEIGDEALRLMRNSP
jgi:transcriptional regulator with XRE-family HTH domain